jgi:hypothetical protein
MIVLYNYSSDIRVVNKEEFGLGGKEVFGER